MLVWLGVKERKHSAWLPGTVCGKAERQAYSLQIPAGRIRRQENPGDRRALLDKRSLVELWLQRFLCDLTTKEQRKLLVFIERKQLLEVLTLCSLFLKKLTILEYKLLYNVVLFSAVQKSESATCIHISPSHKIMASGSITSWETDGKTVETVSDFTFLRLQNHCRWWLQSLN